MNTGEEEGGVQGFKSHIAEEIKDELKLKGAFGNQPDEIFESFEKIVRKNNLRFEEYPVQTADGYRLTLFRIPGEIGDTSTGKKVVFFQHGLFDSADCWISHTNNLAPAIVVAKANYDVWLGNTRGNKYSRSHMRLNPDSDKAFWDYSFAEMGKFDIPANLDFITKFTGV